MQLQYLIATPAWFHIGMDKTVSTVNHRFNNLFIPIVWEKISLGLDFWKNPSYYEDTWQSVKLNFLIRVFKVADRVAIFKFPKSSLDFHDQA